MLLKTVHLLYFTLIVFVFTSCSKAPKEKEVQKDPEEKVEVAFDLLWATDTIFKTPESALYDAERDVIYVSNINQNPRQKDGNGFISKISKDGQPIEVEWVTGMSSPKGMGLVDTTLYVTDVDEVIAINVLSAEIIQRYPVSPVGMLNDIAIDEAGRVFITDMDSSKIFVLENNEISLWKEGLNKPNGIYVEADRILIASSGDGTFKAYDRTTKEATLLGDGMSKGDGIVKTSLGDYVVSDWNGEIFLVQGEEVISIFSSKEQEIQTADIGIIDGEDIIMVPTFFDNRVVAYRLAIKNTTSAK
ncbi:ATP-binding protein [Fulvivirga sp. M361]|uniref:SMP-30/gluconolactonase/LRE family protein n=1 Tax=Fulvivirga sp. M361 TaxID=2594266 RepID=UPI00117AF913|nr:ATP-binding protein [Fulvivirga sp. M361]TRX62732.1 ATP-binding protein [Fulvivirga sp. M361]